MQQKKKKPYKYNIFKNYPPSEKTEKNSFDFDNRLNVKLGQNYKSPIKNSLSAPKRSYSFSQNENNDKFSNFSPNFLRLSQKYLKESNLAINNKANLILGEFLCINCDEFIDIDDMNTHSKICEKMPESKDLITINYKLEKTKTAVLINMKNETRLEKGLEECLHILINCIQKTICANHKVDDFVQVIDDLDDICKELYLHVTPKNRVYITLVNRIQELAIFKRQMVIHRKNKANQLNDDSYQKLNNQNKNQVINNNIIYSRKTTKKYSIINQDKKIFAPSTTHFAYVEQNENDWNRYFEKLDPNTIKYQQKKKSSKKIFRETENYKKNENFILAKPKEIFLAPKIISQRNIVISSKENYNESDNLKKIKSFLEERETQRSKFNEKISKLSIPEQYKDNNNCLILNGDLNRRKRFLELAKKLKDKMYPNKNPNDVSNSELYEECQNNQIHENNWKDFVEQKFKNSY